MGRSDLVRSQSIWKILLLKIELFSAESFHHSTVSSTPTPLWVAVDSKRGCVLPLDLSTHWGLCKPDAVPVPGKCGWFGVARGQVLPWWLRLHDGLSHPAPEMSAFRLNFLISVPTLCSHHRSVDKGYTWHQHVHRQRK